MATPNPQIAAMHSLRDALLIAKRTRDLTSALALLQKVNKAIKLHYAVNNKSNGRLINLINL